MTGMRQSLGARGEAIARERLEAAGYRIRETNYRTSSGELDIVAEEGEFLVFVEVRARRGRSFGSPEESIGPRKAGRLVRLAEQYAQSHPDAPQHLRIDVVAVELAGNGRLNRVEIIRNAVSA
ncbi:MAG: YraN family protein [Dehalococcoidia bacterium]|nr:YraN family protein [Dehalococcoidia bacterium]